MPHGPSMKRRKLNDSTTCTASQVTAQQFQPNIIDDEVLSCIFNPSLMRFEDCLKFESVSRQFQSSAVHFYKRLKSVDISRFYGFRYPTHSSGHNRTEIKIANDKFSDMVKKVCTYCKNLESLKGLGSCVWRTEYIDEHHRKTTCDISKQQYAMLATLTKIRELQFDMCPIDTLSFQKFIMRLNNLTTLEINR